MKSAWKPHVLQVQLNLFADMKTLNPCFIQRAVPYAQYRCYAALPACVPLDSAHYLVPHPPPPCLRQSPSDKTHVLHPSVGAPHLGFSATGAELVPPTVLLIESLQRELLPAPVAGACEAFASGRARPGF